MRTVLIIGGTGFVGRTFVSRLSVLGGYRIIVVDMHSSNDDIADGGFFLQGDVRDGRFLQEVFYKYKPDIVVHLASFGMSGSSMLSKEAYDINIEGVRNTISSCINANVGRLIYISTYNVVFGGQIVDGADESMMPYFPIEKHTDLYSPSKAIAEKILLEANGAALSGGGKLLTCAIRPAAIYGEKETRHIPRIIKYIDSGLLLFRMDHPVIVDWLYIDNLIQALILVLMRMLAAKDENDRPSGHAYFISDGSPIDNFEFLRLLMEARGRAYPSILVPLSFMLSLATISENIFYVSRRIGLHFVDTFLTRAEVYKACVTHHFSIDKARRDFFYSPILSTKEGVQKVAAFYKEYLHNHHFFAMPAWGWWLSILLLMRILYLVAFQFVGTYARSWPGFFLRPFDFLGLYVFGSHDALRSVFWFAAGAHACEALYAIYLAVTLGCHGVYVALWAAQTFLLGFPSLMLLLQRVKFMKEKKD